MKDMTKCSVCTITLVACWLTGPLVTGPLVVGAQDKNDGVIDVGSKKQLFIDDRFIASSRGVELTVNPPHRDGHVLLAADQPWEKGHTIGVYSSVLKEQGKVKMWYDLRRPSPGGPYDYELRVCYAESENGIDFIKPQLGLHEVDGSTANNVVMPGIVGGCSVWIDPHAPPDERYKNQAKVYPSSEFHMHSSPDGLRWKLFAKLDPGPGGWDTQSIVFWDPKPKRYALFTRRWFRHERRDENYRTVRRLESDDLRNWDNQSIVMQADEIDLATHKTSTGQPAVDYYGADVFKYSEAEDVYVMLAQAFWHWHERMPSDGPVPQDEFKHLGPSTFDVRLAVSRDGKHFKRAGNRQTFLSNGPAGRFDSRFVWAMPHPVRMGDSLWIYYVGGNRDHDFIIDPAANGQYLTGISRAVLRLDGFVSADADYTGGEITTPPIRFAGAHLELNVETGGGGSMLVEMLDESEQPIPGYTKSDAIVVQGNSVRMPVRWKSTNDVSQHAGRSVRLRFHLQDCKLYAFQFRNGL